jgi:hypothetical protein
MRPLARVFGSLLMASSALVALPQGVAAATFTVNTTTDATDDIVGDDVCATSAGQCSLRAAIDEADTDATADRIIVPAGEYHLILGSLVIDEPTMIEGAGAAVTIIEPDTAVRIFRIESTAMVTISGVTLQGGLETGDHGGAIVNLGDLTLVSATVRDNVAGQSGGAIDSRGSGNTLTIERSTISGNRALGGNGGGINFGGAGSSLAITNSTISSNSAAENGGGIHVAATATAVSATLTENRADHDTTGPSGDGGGLFLAPGGTLTLQTTVVAGNIDASAGAEAPDCSGGPTSGGSNLIGSYLNCSYTADPTDKVNVSAQLGPLADNGGPTMTHAPNTGSPAIDGVMGPCEATDQRGVPRPQGAACDIGAYELALCGGAAVNKIALDGVAFVGTSGPDVVLGTNGNDSIVLGEGDDKACAAGGDDQVTGGAGNDGLDGGAGTDRLVETGDVDFLLTASVLTGLGTDSLVGIELATLTGGASANLFDASTFPGPVILRGAEGDDGLIPGPANDELDGGTGLFDLVLAGGNVDFKITDTNVTGLGTDALIGIEGAFIIGDSAGNTVDASTFNGSLFAAGGGGADTLLGGKSPFGDFLLGDGGNDLVRGGDGPDFLFGGRGRDRLRGQGGKDLLRGEGGNDSLSGGARNDRLFGGSGMDAMDGGRGRDLCNGGKKPDTARRCERVRSL